MNFLLIAPLLRVKRFCNTIFFGPISCLRFNRFFLFSRLFIFLYGIYYIFSYNGPSIKAVLGHTIGRPPTHDSTMKKRKDNELIKRHSKTKMIYTVNIWCTLIFCAWRLMRIPTRLAWCLACLQSEDCFPVLSVMKFVQYFTRVVTCSVRVVAIGQAVKNILAMP